MRFRKPLLWGASILVGLSVMAAEPAATKSDAAAAAAPVLESDAAAAWKQTQKLSEPALPPAEWTKKSPSKEEVAAYRLRIGKDAAVAADLAKEFVARFPKDGKVDAAKKLRREMLTRAVELGLKERTDELVSLGDGTSPDGQESSPVDKRMQLAVAAAMKHRDEGMEKVFAEFEIQLRLVMKDFPKAPEPYSGLLQIASQLPPEKGEPLLAEVEAAVDKGIAPGEFKKGIKQIRAMAEAARIQAARVGKPLDLQFKAVDGRAVDLAALKGKVVLVDFWATWCGPCVAELPHVKEAYDKYHDKGFEIIGISLDQDKEALEQFTKDKKMTWPQYFDGEGWGNKYAKEFGINGIPAMWLVDKKGVLIDLKARENLAEKVAKQLEASVN